MPDTSVVSSWKTLVKGMSDFRDSRQNLLPSAVLQILGKLLPENSIAFVQGESFAQWTEIDLKYVKIELEG